jgi:uncharacterized membrane protein YphA (DoxX/SURF4 family)
VASTKTRSRILLGLSILLALVFLMSGGSKLVNAKSAAGLPYGQQFIAWGFPDWARFVVGTAEVLGAIGLLVPRARFYAAGGLTFLMLGAVITHLRVAEYGYAPIPLLLGLLTTTIAWMAWPMRGPLPRTTSTEAQA